MLQQFVCVLLLDRFIWLLLNINCTLIKVTENSVRFLCYAKMYHKLPETLLEAFDHFETQADTHDLHVIYL